MSRRVLTAPRRGGFKYLRLTAEQRETDYIRVRRKIKVGRAPARRRRFWIEREEFEVYEYTKYIADRRTTPPTLFEMRVRRRFPRGADPVKGWPGSEVWEKGFSAFDDLRQYDVVDLVVPRRGVEKAGIRRVEGGPFDVIRVARMDEFWKEIRFRDVGL